jgi:hypothetical protein
MSGGSQWAARATAGMPSSVLVASTVLTVLPTRWCWRPTVQCTLKADAAAICQTAVQLCSSCSVVAMRLRSLQRACLFVAVPRSQIMALHACIVFMAVCDAQTAPSRCSALQMYQEVLPHDDHGLELTTCAVVACAGCMVLSMCRHAEGFSAAPCLLLFRLDCLIHVQLYSSTN